MANGQKVTFAEEGDQAPGITPGDIIIVIKEKPHPTFKRKVSVAQLCSWKDIKFDSIKSG
jgi:DnaJ-class molecular chaperone